MRRSLKTFSLLAASVIVFAISAAAQTAASPTPTPKPRPDCANRDRLTAEERDLCDTPSEPIAPTADVAAGQLPASVDNAWILYLVTTGGYTGRGLPTVILRSTNEYACGSEAFPQFKPLPPDSVEELSELIKPKALTKRKGDQRVKPATGYACNDCYVTRLFISLADGDKNVFIASEEVDKIPRIAKRLDEISDAVRKIGVCR